MVQRRATRYDNLQVHSWPDDQLIEATSGQLRQQLRTMQQAVSPEKLGEWSAPPNKSQESLTEDEESLDRLI